MALGQHGCTNTGIGLSILGRKGHANRTAVGQLYAALPLNMDEERVYPVGKPADFKAKSLQRAVFNFAPREEWCGGVVDEMPIFKAVNGLDRKSVV